MIKAESKIVENESCELHIATEGTVEELYIEGAIIIKNLVINISERVDADKKVILGDILKEIVIQMGDK